MFLPENGKSCIDGDILLKDGLLYVLQDGRTRQRHQAGTTRSLTSGKWTEHEGYKQQTPEAVEGSSVFKLIDSDKYLLIYDVYMKGAYQFTESTDLMDFQVIDHEISMDFHPRHGSVIPITREELDGLLQKWGKPEEFSMNKPNPALDGFFADPYAIYSNKTNKYYIYPPAMGITVGRAPTSRRFHPKILSVER